MPHQSSTHHNHGHSSCGYCGKETHVRDKCPAKSATCSNCNKKGHYKSVCHSKPHGFSRHQDRRRGVNELSDYMDSEEDDFLGHIYSICKTTTRGQQTFSSTMNHTCSNWTQAHLSLSWMNLGLNLNCSIIRPNNVTAQANTKLDVIGSFQAKLQYKDSEKRETLYVLKGQTSSLLSRTACMKLGLVSCINSISDDKPDFREEFPCLF